MASRIVLRFLFTFLFAISIIKTISCKKDEDFVFGGCAQQKYAPASAYESNLNSLLTSLVNSATYSAYNNFTVTGSTRNDVVYGLYQCRADLSMPDCASCVARSVSRLSGLCPAACGAAVQLQECYVKYDNATFLGVEDKTIVAKKCGTSDGYQAEAMGRRDAVMAALAATSGPFRVGGSGDVQGLAQCVGDLSVAQCQDCVSEAIGRLKTDCGTAIYGDMFLAKCYARYTTGGAQGYDAKSHSNGKSNNHGEKTFAIIIGLLAGVALLIIFLVFIRKIFGGNGK